MAGGGGSGSSGGTAKSQNVAAAGPARSLATYPQYNPVMYQGMQPGATPAIPGMGAPIASYMPAVNGLPGFGGVPAQQLVQSLMAGYAGVPMVNQPTGANAPGMGFMDQPNPVPTIPDTYPKNGKKNRKQKFADWQAQMSAEDVTP